jgi:peptidoglycan/xylan/chitin deacetylase (PgdA/CDA1 family)
MRAGLKHALEVMLVRSGGTDLARLARRGQGLILAYHGIVPHGEPAAGEYSLHLPQRRFAAHLDLLSRTHDVVPLGVLLDGRSGRRPRAAITFDDAYQGAVTAGVEELRRRAIPATIFVAPAFVGGQSFWWDALAEPGRGLDRTFRDRALAELRGEQTAVYRWAQEQGRGLQSLPRFATAATEAELQAAVQVPGIALGSHSWSHPNLTRLSPDELQDELEQPIRWLRERFPGATIPWVAYPYGLFSPQVEQAAKAAGYAAGLAIAGGWVRRQPPDRFALPRLNLPAGVSRYGFMLRTSGLWSR